MFCKKQTKCVLNNSKLLQKSSPISSLVFILPYLKLKPLASYIYVHIYIVETLSFMVRKYSNKRTSVNNKIVFIGFDQVLQHLLHVQIKPDVIAK